MPFLALKIDVSTYRGTLVGVPRLLDILGRFGAEASFLFAFGRDHSGRAPGAAWRAGLPKRARRLSDISDHGVASLFYGTLLPGPDIGRACADVMRSVRNGGHEPGIHCWDAVTWRHGIIAAGMAWTEREMRLACNQYANVFHEQPSLHGAAGWSMNRHALRLTQRLGFRYASDCRGSHPFMPVWDGEVVHCPQLPTTLPTLDELIDPVTADVEAAGRQLLELTREPPPAGHVFTLRAEIEGMKQASPFERLLLGWKQQGYDLVSLGRLHDSLEAARLPRHEVGIGNVPGRAEQVLLQGVEFLADGQG